MQKLLTFGKPLIHNIIYNQTEGKNGSRRKFK